MMSSHGSGTIVGSCKRRRSVLQPIHQNGAPLNATPPSFQEDLTVEILSRLPVKSLIRFRCVSKPWNSQISSSEFVKYHLHQSTTDPTLRNHRFLGEDSKGNGFRLSRSVQSLIDNPSPSPPVFGYLSFEMCHERTAIIVGSYNGLICWVNNNNDSYVSYLNPSTRLKSRSPCFRHPSSASVMFGFGYDHLSNSYKTVAICRDPEAEIEKKTTVKVYALGAPTSWRKIHSFPFVHRCHSSGKFVSGTLNWLAAHPDQSLYVVSVDIGTDTCRKVALPHVDKNELLDDTNLWVLGGCLCFSYVFNRTQFVLWRMKLYGVTESWTTLLNISYLDFGIDPHFKYFPQTLFMLDKGEVLLETEKNGVFILYNPRHKSYKHLEFPSDTSWFDGTTHIESLVSPCPIRSKLRFRGGSSPTTLTTGTRNAPTNC